MGDGLLLLCQHYMNIMYKPIIDIWVYKPIIDILFYPHQYQHLLISQRLPRLLFCGPGPSSSAWCATRSAQMASSRFGRADAGPAPRMVAGAVGATSWFRDVLESYQLISGDMEKIVYIYIHVYN